MQAEYDIVIIGGGMVGATLAFGLAQALPDSLSLAVVEAIEPALDETFLIMCNRARQPLLCTFSGYCAIFESLACGRR